MINFYVRFLRLAFTIVFSSFSASVDYFATLKKEKNKKIQHNIVQICHTERWPYLRRYLRRFQDTSCETEKWNNFGISYPFLMKFEIEAHDGEI